MTFARLTWTEATHRLASASGNANVSCNLVRKCLSPLYWESHFIFLHISLGGSQLRILYARWTMYFDMFFLILILNALLARSTFGLVLAPSHLSFSEVALTRAKVDTYQRLCVRTLSLSASLRLLIWRGGEPPFPAVRLLLMYNLCLCSSSYQLEKTESLEVKRFEELCFLFIHFALLSCLMQTGGGRRV